MSPESVVREIVRILREDAARAVLVKYPSVPMHAIVVLCAFQKGSELVSTQTVHYFLTKKIQEEQSSYCC